MSQRHWEKCSAPVLLLHNGGGPGAGALGHRWGSEVKSWLIFLSYGLKLIPGQTLSPTHLQIPQESMHTAESQCQPPNKESGKWAFHF